MAKRKINLAWKSAATLLFLIVGGSVFLRHVMQTSVIRDIEFTPDGKTLVAGGGQVVPHDGDELQGLLWLWDSDTLQLKATIAVEPPNVHHLAIRSDGPTATIQGRDKSYYFWNLNTLEKGRMPYLGIVTFEPPSLNIWETETGYQNRARKIQHLIDRNEKTGFPILSITRYYTMVAIADEKFNIQILDLRNDRRVPRLVDAPKSYIRPDCVKFSPDLTELTIADGDDLKIWDVESGEISRRLESGIKGIRFIRYSDDNKKLAVANYQSAEIWDAREGTLIGECKLPWRLF